MPDRLLNVSLIGLGCVAAFVVGTVVGGPTEVYRSEYLPSPIPSNVIVEHATVRRVLAYKNEAWVYFDTLHCLGATIDGDYAVVKAGSVVRVEASDLSGQDAFHCHLTVNDKP